MAGPLWLHGFPLRHVLLVRCPGSEQDDETPSLAQADGAGVKKGSALVPQLPCPSSLQAQNPALRKVLQPLLFSSVTWPSGDIPGEKPLPLEALLYFLVGRFGPYPLSITVASGQRSLASDCSLPMVPVCPKRPGHSLSFACPCRYFPASWGKPHIMEVPDSRVTQAAGDDRWSTKAEASKGPQLLR